MYDEQQAQRERRQHFYVRNINQAIDTLKKAIYHIENSREEEACDELGDASENISIIKADVERFLD